MDYNRVMAESKTDAYSNIIAFDVVTRKLNTCHKDILWLSTLEARISAYMDLVSKVDLV